LAARQRRKMRAAKIVYRVLQKRSTRSTPQEARKLKFHMKKMNSLDLHSILQLATVGCDNVLQQQLESTLRYVLSNTPYHEACKAPAEYVDNKDSNLTSADVQKMKEAANCEPCTCPKRYAKIWTVTEKEKERRRFILWPKQLNDELEKRFGVPSIDISESIEHMKGVPKDSGAIAFDLEKSYYQVPLAPEVRPYFAFALNGEIFQPTVLPMGVNFAPALMHNVLKVLATTGVPHVTTDCYIDNVRFHGIGLHEDKVRRAATIFQARCKQVGATLNDEDVNDWHTKGLWLGTEVDYRLARVRLAKKSINKLKEEATALNSANITLNDVQVIFGLLFYGSRVLRLPTVEYFTAIKYYRRRQSEMLSNFEIAASDQPANIWACAKKQLFDWISRIQENEWTEHLPDTDSSFILCTDASLTGWGAVLFNMISGEINALGGKWTRTYEPKDINTLEMRAVEEGAGAFRDILNSKSINGLDLLVDNTSTMYTLRKGHSSKYDLNAALRRTLRSLPPSLSIRVGYIDTAHNPADSLSRGRDLESGGTSSVRGAVDRKEAVFERVKRPVF